MNKDLTLLILAAGMGSRFGGLKQIEPVGPNGEFIIDYSIYDALEAGFNKIVFIIKEENFELFKDTVGKRIEDKVKVEYVFQKSGDLPSEYGIEEREKPWGTAHAIRAARDVINEPFAMINSDDFYGRDAYIKIAEFLGNNSKDKEYGMVGYYLKNTLTSYGSVKRGVCEEKNNSLVKLVECNIEDKNGALIATPLDGRDSFEVSENVLVAMNFFGFMPGLFDILEKRLHEFLTVNKDKLDKAEFLIPDVLGMEIEDGNINMTVFDTTARWLGVTYKEDTPELVNAINEMIEDEIYPKKLWN